MSRDTWNATDITPQTGRHYIITGANSGLGLITARELARAGATITMAVRNVDKGKVAAAHIGGDVTVEELDLADLGSIHRFADRTDHDIDVLINNAGIMFVPYGKTSDGFERHIGTNHLGHYALTNLLLPRIQEKVVTLSSQAHRRGSINLADLQWENRKYSPTGAYGASKLANLLFSLELQQRLTATGSDIVSLSSHPGYSATNLQSHSESRPAELLMKIANRTVAQPADMGALPTLFAATEPLPPASYVGPNGLYEFRGYPTLVGRSNAASNLDLAVHLWEKSEELTGIRFPLQ